VIRSGALLVTAIGVALAACGSSTTKECVVGADCASGACDASGRCVAAPPTPDGGTVDGASHDDASTTTDASNDGFVVPDGGCIPNHDGTIDRSEVPLQAGLRATYRIATNATIDTTGTMMGGMRAWDFSGALPGDHDVIVETLPIAGTWYAPDFGSATYSTKLADSSDLLGVFQTSATALSLLGVVSPSSGATQTKLTYATPIATLAFPFHVGSTWDAMSNVSGQAQGVATFYTESYTNKVDATGSVKTPFGTFTAQRVSTVLTRTVGGFPTVTRTFVFVAECFGPIATIVSQSNEQTAEFTSAAEVRRLAP
jgi:hypothetical protein